MTQKTNNLEKNKNGISNCETWKDRNKRVWMKHEACQLIEACPPHETWILSTPWRMKLVHSMKHETCPLPESWNLSTHSMKHEASSTPWSMKPIHSVKHAASSTPWSLATPWSMKLHLLYEDSTPWSIPPLPIGSATANQHLKGERNP